MSDDSRYNFRFGTYGSQNPLYSAIEVEAEYSESSSSMAGVIDGGGSGITASTEGLSSFEGLDTFLSNNRASITFTRNIYGVDPPSKIKISSERFNSEITSNVGYSLTISMDIELEPLNSSTPLKAGTVTMIVLLEDNSGNKVQKSKGYTWPNNLPLAVGSISLQLDADTLKNYTFLGITLNIAENTKPSSMGNINGTYTFKNFNFLFKKITKEATTIPKYMSVGGEKIYLCPWELKHIDSITMSLAGSTSIMGVPNKPASRTQIFDTGGPVRTFKISGRRYDWEENVSNWDFVNTQFNLASDSEYPSNNPFTYVGLSWLLSTMQILLKGYQFYIGNDDTTDKRFLSSEPYSLEYAIPLAVVPEALPHNEGAIIKYTGETGTYVENAYYICDVIYNSNDEPGEGPSARWVKYIPPVDNGFNVALTSLSTTFSESEPGLMSYSISLTERYKNGTKLYQPYNPEYIDATQ